jgi:two-component system, OmpR family, phosphate regulon sensor histidine kinase PhoR
MATFVRQFLRMKKLKGLSVLMGITLLVITGFQLYWLNNNYDRENRSLEMKTNIAFQEAVRNLQTAKLKLKEPFNGDSADPGRMQVFIDDNMPSPKMRVGSAPEEEIITMVNTMRNKLVDSAKKLQKRKSTFFISVNRDSDLHVTDTFTGTLKKRVANNHIIRYLYGIDSLQDSLRIPEITAAYAKRLKEENMVIPFSIHRTDSVIENDEPGLSDVTVGFAHPVTFHLELGNRVPYLMKKITQPVLFSIFLLGVTIFCFVLFYRNLLAQQRLTAIKNDFISNITHELKTPIATVSVAIEALKNFNALDDPQKAKEYLDISGNELQRLSLLVDKVLKLSMFENKEIALQKEPFDLAQLTEDVMASMKLQFEKQKAICSLEISSGNFVIEADKLHLTSVIYNLLDNALKYSKGNPEIKVSLIDQKQYLELRVSDNGIGIAPEYKRKIFEQFFRVPSGNRHNIKGYGLGLSYVNHIVASHQGFIEAETELGKGSTFIVKLPFAEAPAVYYDKGRVVRKIQFKMGKHEH